MNNSTFVLFAEVDKKFCLNVRKSQIPEFSGSFRYSIFANFLGVLVRISQICKLS
jgi:hypothetical protein